MPQSHDCIIFNHPHWVLLNKPAGYSVQELALLWRDDFPAFHPVHRLDKDTTGLWLVALNSESNRELSQLFQHSKVNKAYLAITQGKPSKKQGKVVGDMARSRRSQWQLLRSKNNPAQTLFKSIGLENGLRLVLCRLLTGKTHQIRVAMKSLGSPIAGDGIYAAENKADFDRLYLHAYALSFNYQGQIFSFSVLPTEGVHFLSQAFMASMQSFQQPFDVLSIK